MAAVCISRFACMANQFAHSIAFLNIPRLYVHLEQSQPPSLSRILRNHLPSLAVEWKMCNVVSTFFLVVDLWIFQVSGTLTDTLTRTAAFTSAAFAAFVFSSTWILIIHSSALRHTNVMPHARGDVPAPDGELVEPNDQAIPGEAPQPNIVENRVRNKCLWWNVPVLFALPLTGIVWSAFWFTTVLFLSLLWNNNATDTGSNPARGNATSGAGHYVPRAVVTMVLAVGAVYLILLIRALRSW